MYNVGDQIGSYILKAQIGRGAFGVVWLAEEATALTSHTVALKLPNSSDIDLDAIRQEATLWEQVKGHPNVLPIIKADIVGNQVFIASEYTPDGSLADRLAANGGEPLAPADAVEMAKGILSGLAHLHSRSVIHRDLKPENILLQGETPRIADFGIARAIRESGTTMVAGTPSYMAPECFDGIRSEQTDIWAAGVILCQMVTGRLPYPQPDLVSIVKAVVYNPPDIDRSKAAPEILRIIDRALEKSAADRYQSAAEMLRDLRALSSSSLEDFSVGDTISEENLPTRRVGAPAGLATDATLRAPTFEKDGSAAATAVMASVPTSREPRKRNFALIAGSLITLAAVTGAGVYFGIGRGPSPSPDEISQTNSNTKPKPAASDAVRERTMWAEWALLLEVDEYEKIVSETTAELARNPESVVSYRMRATAYQGLSDNESARLDVREVVRLTVEPATAEQSECRCYALKILNKPNEALASCSKAIELDPQMALAYNIRGTVYHQKRQFDLAVAEYTKAIELSPRKTFFENRALAYREQADLQSAKKDERQAMALGEYIESKKVSKTKPAGTRQAQVSKPVRTPIPRPYPMATPPKVKSVGPPSGNKTDQ